MGRRTFDAWLTELRQVTEQFSERKLEDFPEFDRSDAMAYFRDKSPPILYYEECLSESDEGEPLGSIMNTEVA